MRKKNYNLLYSNWDKKEKANSTFVADNSVKPRKIQSHQILSRGRYIVVRLSQSQKVVIFINCLQIVLKNVVDLPRDVGVAAKIYNKVQLRMVYRDLHSKFDVSSSYNSWDRCVYSDGQTSRRTNEHTDRRADEQTSRRAWLYPPGQ